MIFANIPNFECDCKAISFFSMKFENGNYTEQEISKYI
jgi:hypothetical protein